MKRVFYFVMLLVLCLFCVNCNQHDDVQLSTNVDSLDELIAKREKSSKILAVYKKFYTEYVTRSNSVNLIYPDYFGGMYISEEGEAVFLTLDTVSTSDKIRRNAGCDQIIIKQCKYSYNELMDLFNGMNERVKGSTSMKELGISSFRIKTIENYIEVALVRCNEANISLFKSKVIDSPIIRFVERPLMRLDSKMPEGE